MVAALTTVAAAGWLSWLRPLPARVKVGPHELAPGEHYEGDPLPRSHPLLRVIYRAGPDATAAAASVPAAAQPLTLKLRRHCAWGSPGRDPYQGSVEDALRTAQLPEEVVQQLSRAIHAKRPSDRLTISNTGIQADNGGQIYNQRSFAMTYGRTLCLGTSVNFEIGHIERASLYAAADAGGRLHSVMVPDVCGNVSILSAERTASEEAFADDPAASSPLGGRHATAASQVQDAPEPGTLACVVVALAAALTRLGRRKRAVPAAN